VPGAPDADQSVDATFLRIEDAAGSITCRLDYNAPGWISARNLAQQVVLTDRYRLIKQGKYEMTVRPSTSQLLAAGLISAAALALSGCSGLLLGAGASAGVAVAQERSIGAAVDDAGIEIQINEAMLKDSESLFRHVDVEVVEGRVLLTGNVAVADDRVKTARIAWKVEGVKEVLNELQVTNRGSIVDYLKDGKITAHLRLLLLQDREISDINFTVETVNGIVYLLGLAQSQAELDKLINHARNINGVTKVINHVRLKTDSRRN
jgi:osmotically-inducible protein OsmY